jgi:hypothetical protein
MDYEGRIVNVECTDGNTNTGKRTIVDVLLDCRHLLLWLNGWELFLMYLKTL